MKPPNRPGHWIAAFVGASLDQLGFLNSTGSDPGGVKSESCWIFLAGRYPLTAVHRGRPRPRIPHRADSSHLPAFELGDLDRAPSLRSADERASARSRVRALGEDDGNPAGRGIDLDPLGADGFASTPRARNFSFR